MNAYLNDQPVSPSPRALRARASQAYGQQSRSVASDELIAGYLPMVKHVVRKVTTHVGYNRDIDDLVSAGTVGLVKAARAFDPSRNVEFKTYAYIRIKGAVIDELRSGTFVSSAMNQKIRLIEELYDRFTSDNAAPPSDQALADQAGISVDELYRIMEQSRRQSFLSIHGLCDDGDAPLASLVPPDAGPSPLEQAQRSETIERLTQALLELPRKDRTVILLYYERDLTMKEIAEVLEVTESRVSQIHAAALFKLSMKIKSGVTQ